MQLYLSQASSSVINAACSNTPIQHVHTNT